MKPVN